MGRGGLGLLVLVRVEVEKRVGRGRDFRCRGVWFRRRRPRWRRSGGRWSLIWSTYDLISPLLQFNLRRPLSATTQTASHPLLPLLPRSDPLQPLPLLALTLLSRHQPLQSARTLPFLSQLHQPRLGIFTHQQVPSLSLVQRPAHHLAFHCLPLPLLHLYTTTRQRSRIIIILVHRRLRRGGNLL